MIGTIRVGGLAIAAVAAVAFAACDTRSGSVTNLRVGDCIDDPGSGIIAEVQHRPCDEPHGAEVLYVGDYPNGGDTIPSGDVFDDYLFETCVPEFESYTGRPFSEDTELDIAPITPTDDGWRDGDRQVLCLIVPIEGGTLTGSMKSDT